MGLIRSRASKQRAKAEAGLLREQARKVRQDRRVARSGGSAGHEQELRALAVRARTLLDAAASEQINQAWREEWATWRGRYQEYLEAEAAGR